MKFKKSIVVLIVFILLTSIFNFNSAAINIINSETNHIENKSNFNQYIIQFKNEPLIRFRNRLKIIVKHLFLNLTENVKNNFISQKIYEYKNSLISNHTKIKEDILKLLDDDISFHGIFLRDFYDLFNGISIKGITEELVIKIKNLPNIKNVFPDQKIYATLDESIPLINADDVWRIKDDFGKDITGQGITIAFLDTGVDYNHPDLKDNYISNGSYDFVNNDADPMDDDGHGTHVTGIAVGKGIESNYQYVGVAPDAKFYSFKILNYDGEGNFSNYYDAMMRALDPNDDGDYSDKVDVISLSIGTSEPGDPDDSLCQVLDNVVREGVTVVVAAGNLGPESNTITSPGCARNSICVGSTNKNDLIAYSSSRGPVEWDGNSIDKPDVVAPGVNIKSTKNNGGYVDNSGTSMATPHVAGAAALIIQYKSEISPYEVKQALKQSAVNLGYDINTQGNGRIDVLKAINPERYFIIKAPDTVNETQIFKIKLFDNNDNRVRAWTLILVPFHIPRLKYGHSRRFIAPLIINKNREFVKGKIIVIKLHGGFQIVRKDFIIFNKIRVNN
ncbi:MAG: S8 family serine peptidase [Thermoplasmatales archaeon]|nr:MAG: S8 family serine peptidase [Thermoplasmatales archaeon]